MKIYFGPLRSVVAIALGVLSCACEGATEGYQRAALIPPSVPREFRGVWVATVANIDWPSARGLSTAEQKRELLRILDRAAQLRMNAVVFQVRPACDALYASTLEPWSEYLTGRMGRAPAPFYDPLALAVTEAHKRGLELHAWVNPYRALHFSSTSPVAASHLSRTHPEWVKRCGKYLWLDPGEPGVRDHCVAVVMDLVRRYDIDGLHFDDYFYPDGRDLGEGWDFPDDGSWSRQAVSARRRGMSREDWRRENVNGFIARVYRSIKDAKPWVKFGVSPHGIWRPGHPRQIKGLDAYAVLYADSRKWLVNGWLDYFAPQLYWPIDAREQGFAALLDWWARQNVQGRHLWPGLNAAKADQWQPDEILRQIWLVRSESEVSGYVCYSANSLMSDSGWVQALRREVNARPALVPASPWLCTNWPEKPVVSLSGSRGSDLQLRLGKESQRTRTQWWLIQTRSAGLWQTEIISGKEWLKRFSAAWPDVIAVSMIDRSGVASQPVVYEKGSPISAHFRAPHEDAGTH